MFQKKGLFVGLLLAVGVVLFSKGLLEAAAASAVPDLTDGISQVQYMKIGGDQVGHLKEKTDNWVERITVNYLYHGLESSTHEPGLWFSFFLSQKKKDEYAKVLETVWADAKVFPLGEINRKKQTFENSFLEKRSYGGTRNHEGCDIMGDDVEPGEIPVRSVSDGVVEKKGWLKLGGYRLGIRAPHGAYFYYAHLDQYEPKLREGSKVNAGDVIGYMGDTGYGEEGTRGKFPVHLHFGIYLDYGENEIPINPYEVLRYLFYWEKA